MKSFVSAAVVFVLTCAGPALAQEKRGLVWNDRAFFPASHVLMISYGTTFNTGKPDERFEPLLQIQLGVKTVLLAEYLEPVPAKLFEHLFRDDTRRYWHGHN